MIRQSALRRRRAVSEPREALRIAIAASNVDAARLSRLIKRHPSYVGRFLRDGVPAALDQEHHELIAAFLGLDPAELGDREYSMRRTPA
jgi:hypothetical protein